MSKLEVAVLIGKESKEWLERLSTELDRLEKLSEPAEKEVETEEDFAPKAKRGRPKKVESFDDEEEENTSFDKEEDEEDEEKSEIDVEDIKKGKKSKLTVDDVNDACKERASESNRAEVLAILKKKFSVKSVSELEPSQYADVVKAMKR